MLVEFELNYHNQFHKAYPGDRINMVKQLWLASLTDFEPTQIIAAGRRAMRESKWLPTLNDLREFATPEPADLGLPDAKRAYEEACHATQPRAEFNWSHPAVYHAGCEADWYFLTTQPRSKAFPVFENCYKQMVARVQRGEDLSTPTVAALPSETHTPLDTEQRKDRLKTLRKVVEL